MRFATLALAAGLGLGLGGAAAQAADITGAGATFPFPVYSKWAEAYRAATGTGLNYQSIGSGGGINQIRARTVDFGATDAPLAADVLQRDNLVQFPTVIGGVVPVVNLQGVAPGQLRLTGELLADIFQGRVERWNDRRIAELNSGVTLPSNRITVIYRSDQSGTTNVFTSYLASASEGWRSALGAGTAVNWPTGQGGRGNEGVAALVGRVANSIGYVEYAYAKQNRLTHVALRNRAGNVVQPELATFQAAAASADWQATPGYGIALTDQPGAQAWPITAPTFVLIPRNAQDPARVTEVLRFFDWAYRSGGPLASELDYVPLPANVVEQVRGTWRSDLGAAAAPVLR